VLQKFHDLDQYFQLISIRAPCAQIYVAKTTVQVGFLDIPTFKQKSGRAKPLARQWRFWLVLDILTSCRFEGLPDDWAFLELQTADPMKKGKTTPMCTAQLCWGLAREIFFDNFMETPLMKP